MTNMNFKQFKDKHIFSFLNELEFEWNNQDSKFPNQTHNLTEWLSIIMEEIGEIAKEINEIDSLEFSKLNKELIQAITLLIRFRYSIWNYKRISKFKIVK